MINPRIPSALLITLATTGMASAAITISGSAPTSTIAQSTAFGGTGSRIFDEAANANHARGNRFVLGDGPDTAFEITGVAIQAQGTQTYSGDTMTLYIYEGTTAQWNTGTGHVGPSTDYYQGTTVTPLTSEAFTITGAPVGGDWVTATLTTPIIVNENSTYGFFFTYVQAGGSDTSFFYRESGSPGNPDDGRTSITTTTHGTTGSRQMNYYVIGTAVPEPTSLALLGLGSLGFLLRRRR